MQAELGGYSKQVIENVRLDTFVVKPVGIVAKCVDLNRHAVITRLQLTHNKCHIQADFWMMLEVIIGISTEGSDIGEPAQINIAFTGRI